MTKRGKPFYSQGDAIGDWTVLREAEPAIRKDGNTRRRMLCRCKCGTEKIVLQQNLKIGRSTGCGCEQAAKTSNFHTRHGMSHSPIYRTWSAMKSRCLSPNNTHFKHYGGRGITVCDRWLVFENFLADMGERPTPKSEIDRIDANGHYEPGNVRWSNRRQQNRNRRDTRYITMNGETLALPDWCDRLNLHYPTIEGRIAQYGWDEVRALTQPVRPKLTRSEVLEIRKLHAAGMGNRAIGKKFGVCAATVFNVHSRRVFADVA